MFPSWGTCAFSCTICFLQICRYAQLWDIIQQRLYWDSQTDRALQVLVHVLGTVLYSMFNSHPSTGPVEGRQERTTLVAFNISFGMCPKRSGSVCLFLHYLYESGLQVRTFAGYRLTRVIVVPRVPDGSNISSSGRSSISRLLCGMLVALPKRVLSPSSLGYRCWTSQRVSLSLLWSTFLYSLPLIIAFLVAVASCKCRGELHALCLEPGVYCWVRWSLFRFSIRLLSIDTHLGNFTTVGSYSHQCRSLKGSRG